MTPLEDKFFMAPSCTCHLLPGPYPGQSRPLCGACADALRKRLASLAGELETCLQRSHDASVRAHAAEQRVRELEAERGRVVVRFQTPDQSS